MSGDVANEVGDIGYVRCDDGLSRLRALGDFLDEECSSSAVWEDEAVTVELRVVLCDVVLCDLPEERRVGI